MRSLIQAFRLVSLAFVSEIRSLELRGPRARFALKSVIAVLLAVTLATWLELDDLSWAAFSGYMVMRSDFATSLPRGVMRCVGTFAGAAAGLFLARWTADNPVVLMAGLIVFGWIGTMQTLLSRFSYAWLFFGLTGIMVTTESLSDPIDTVHFAATRVAEICVGTLACLVVSALFDGGTSRLPTAMSADQDTSLSFRNLWDETWLKDHWPLITHAMRSALALGMQPLMWRGLELTDFSQVVVTSLVVMLVPSAQVMGKDVHSVHGRMVHRAMGCLTGSIMGLLCLSFVGDDFLVTLLMLSAGIGIGRQIEAGREGIGYVGTQFTLGFLVTYVQGPAPATSILPGLERLLGILIGCAAAYIMLGLWPIDGSRRWSQRSGT